MSDMSVKFQKKRGKYVCDEVDAYVKEVDEKIQEKDVEIDALKKQIADLENKVTKLTGDDPSVEEKVELYDKLMKKMGDDYQNLLAPAIAKAKAIEEQADKEYALRIDQAKYSADGIYEAAAGKIADAVDDNMDRLYDLLDEFIYSKTLPGRLEATAKGCRYISKKMAEGINGLMKTPKSFFEGIGKGIKARNARFSAAIASYKACKAAEKEEKAETPAEELKVEKSAPASDVIVDIAKDAD